MARKIGYGRMIRDGRIAKELTQQEFAGRVRASKTTVSNWEREKTKPGLEDINPICQVLDLSPYEFLIALGVLLTPPAEARLPLPFVTTLLRLPEEDRRAVERAARGLAQIRAQEGSVQ